MMALFILLFEVWCAGSVHCSKLHSPSLAPTSFAKKMVAHKLCKFYEAEDFFSSQGEQASAVWVFVVMEFSAEEIDRIIEMAWEDRTSFDAIRAQFGISEPEVIALMRREMKASSFRMWRARVSGRKTKHASKRGFEVGRHKCSRQRTISNNRISKR